MAFEIDVSVFLTHDNLCKNVSSELRFLKSHISVSFVMIVEHNDQCVPGFCLVVDSRSAPFRQITSYAARYRPRDPP
jgi:hypothetical protein